MSSALDRTEVLSTSDLHHHGDAELGAGLLDLAVNVSVEEPPVWLTSAILSACTRLDAYPDPAPATRAVSARHGRAEDEVLLTSGAAQAFTLIAQGLPRGRACIVHPQFTEPEVALRAAGWDVEQTRPERGRRLRPGPGPNPGRLLAGRRRQSHQPDRHSAPTGDTAGTARPGPDPRRGRGLPGLGSRRARQPVRRRDARECSRGALADQDVGTGRPSDRLRARPSGADRTGCHRVQPAWSVSTPALAAAVACSTERALHRGGSTSRPC